MDYFLEEILPQPRVLRATLDRYLEDESLLRQVSGATKQGQYRLILLTGMGSSYFALYPSCIYLIEHELSAATVETSELLHYHARLISDRVLLVIASQSGETVEVKRLLSEFRGRTFIASVTNDAENHLARNSDLALFLYGGEERGPASKTHTTAIAVASLLAMCLTSSMSSQGVQTLYEAVRAMETLLDAWRENRWPG